MNENLGKKITITVVLAIAAILSLLLPKHPFRLGLDLQGGTRVVCRFDFDAALKQGKINAQENANRTQLLLDMCGILRGRIDPNGVTELAVRPEGTDRIVIEIPGVAELASATHVGSLATAIDADATTLTLAPMEIAELKAFPRLGARLQVGSETIVYGSRTQSMLEGLLRGVDGTARTAHQPGERVELVTTDDILQKIIEVGDMQFLLRAEPADFTRLGSDATKERERVENWIKKNPGRPIDDFNRLKPEDGGPVSGLTWYPRRIGKDEPETPIESRLEPLVGTGNPTWIFTGEDLDSVGFSQDQYGYPAVSFDIAQAKKGLFGDFTKASVGRFMAIVLNGEIATLARINSPLLGSGIIEGGAGGFSQKEVTDLVTTLRAGSLRIKPEIESKTRVGATLGEESITRSFYSSMVAIGIIAVFMLFFYHRLGGLSLIGLSINLLLLMGAMAFLRATLTLPGVAGVILTLGMAVDGNILIYERLREELGRGLKALQAVKAAFARANITIIDAHVTQLVAGLILYEVGTGPIRGFATTLNVGILTTLFTVIIVTEVLVLLDLKRGQSNLGMKRVFVNPGWPFMKHSKYVIAGSSVLVVAGLSLFISMPDNVKFGTDFTGGFTMTVKTEDPQPIAHIRELVGQTPGTIGRSATVVPILESGDKLAGYRSFRITYKLATLENAGGAEEAQGEASMKQVQTSLAGVLQKGPIELTVADDGLSAKGRLHLESAHPPADLASALTVLGLKDPKVEALPKQPEVFDFSATLETRTTDKSLLSVIDTRLKGLKDSKGVVFHLSNAVPESAYIGPQVGGELRDKAVMAVLLSLFGTMIYLRIRFAEYAYGIAVVVSLAHDVLIALGALALAAKMELLQAEVDLSMIAAFLTIIGYSQNDTIVIFDRVRENRLKSNKPLAQILDDSINECFGRTILTTSTVVLTLFVLFLFNLGSRNMLEGFSYCLLVGVISGAYSTIYIASPVLLWLENRAARKRGGEGGAKAAKSEPAVVKA